jgi:hypothetical protein
MRRIEAGETGGVVVAYLSRFGRTLVGTLELIQRIDKADGLFASVADQFDISTPNGRLVLNLMLSIAQYELERTSAQWDSAKQRAVERNLHIGGVPFGYRRNTYTDKKGNEKILPLEPDPVEGPIVTELRHRPPSIHRGGGGVARHERRWEYGPAMSWKEKARRFDPSTASRLDWSRSPMASGGHLDNSTLEGVVVNLLGLRRRLRLNVDPVYVLDPLSEPLVERVVGRSDPFHGSLDVVGF